jgi:hypothetical protein
MAVVHSARRVALPADLRPLAGSRRLVVALAEYREGTLRYRELVVGALVRRGARAGIVALWIWVDSLESLWGGRRLWGIPKEPATFTHAGDVIRVHDDQGVIAVLGVGGERVLPVPSLRLPATGFGQIEEQRVFLPGRVRGRPTLGRLRVIEWSDRLPPLSHPARSHRAAVLDPCDFVFPPGIGLGRAG